jgi:hypothetical protein
MMKCSQCGREFSWDKEGGMVASLSGSIMGDEYIETYFYCDSCNKYTLEIFHDRFLGEDDVSIRGPISKEEGDIQVKLMNECPEPWNKKCDCNAHKKYFDGWAG